MRLILFLLKCVLGFLATIGFLIAAGGLAAFFLWKEVSTFKIHEPEMPDSMFLALDLSAGIVEAPPDNALARASLGEVNDLREAVEALGWAAQDPRVKGLVLRAGRGQIGMAQVQELRSALSRFGEAGKPMVAFAETFGEGGDGTLHYYLASTAQEVWLQPSGSLDFTGFQLQGPYISEALEEIGVEAQFGQRKEYKGVMNTFTDDSMPAAVRENLQRLLDSWIGQVARDVGASRGLPEVDVRTRIDAAPYLAGEAIETGLVDRLGYWDEVSDHLLAQASDDTAFVDVLDYRAAAVEPPDSGPVVALIHGLGPIVLAKSENDPLFGGFAMGSDTVADAIRDAADDPEVRSIVFRVDSPGGSYVASDVIWREVVRAREMGTPVIVSMGNVAASGGYFVSAPATKIVAQPGTITGSIGVAAGKFVLTGLWDKLNVSWDGVKAGANADYWSPNRRFSERDWDRFNGFLDNIYDDFTGKVSTGRDLSVTQIEEAAQGRIWTGEDALRLGLVDELGGYREAIALARQSANLDPEGPVQIKVFPEQRDPFEAIFERLIGNRIESPALQSFARVLARFAQAFAPLVESFERIATDPRAEVLRTQLENPS